MQDSIYLDTKGLWFCCVAIGQIVSQFTYDVYLRYKDTFQSDPVLMRMTASKYEGFFFFELQVDGESHGPVTWFLRSFALCASG